MDETTVAPAPRGVDEPTERRPGVPKEAVPHRAEGAHWERPERQAGLDEREHRAGLETITPVAGTAQPLHGLSGMLRRRAYDVPEHYARHWMLLMLADRVDVLEHRLGSRLGEPIRSMGFETVAQRVENNPLAVVAGAVAAAYVTKKILD